jgi:UDP-2,4-diacetamido-2,4,6-trideoxy-beta-L-altropyranose hydrolase
MKHAMLETDIAISNGRQTLYKLVRVGVPTIAIGVAENQLGNIKEW